MSVAVDPAPQTSDSHQLFYVVDNAGGVARRVNTVTGSERALYETSDSAGRRRYGPILIWSYIGLVALLIVMPLIVWAILALVGKTSAFTGGLRDLQDFVVALLAGLSGLSGMAGLVVGRYFSTHQQ